MATHGKHCSHLTRFTHENSNFILKTGVLLGRNRAALCLSAADIFCPVTQVMSRIRWHHRVRFGGVCGGRRPWAELLPWASSGTPLAGWDNLSGGNFEAMPTEPDVRGFLW